MVTRRLYKDQLWASVPCEAGVVRTSKMVKTRKVGDKRGQMAAHCEEEQKLEDIQERRKMEGSSTIGA